MDKIKKKYLFLAIIVLIGIAVGILFSNILSNLDSKLVTTKITTYFNNLKNEIKIDYLKNLITSLKNNFIYLTIIWILGVSIIGLLLNNFILFFKSFILGFSIGSIINIYLFRGLVLSILYVFPAHLLNILVLLIMTYYANNISLKIFNVLFRKKDYQFTFILKKYFKTYLILLIALIFSSIIETFVMPFFIKLFSFLIV